VGLEAGKEAGGKASVDSTSSHPCDVGYAADRRSPRDVTDTSSRTFRTRKGCFGGSFFSSEADTDSSCSPGSSAPESILAIAPAIKASTSSSSAVAVGPAASSSLYAVGNDFPSITAEPHRGQTGSLCNHATRLTSNGQFCRTTNIHDASQAASFGTDGGWSKEEVYKPALCIRSNVTLHVGCFYDVEWGTIGAWVHLFLSALSD
jgi:hypothetical protein